MLLLQKIIILCFVGPIFYSLIAFYNAAMRYHAFGNRSCDSDALEFLEKEAPTSLNMVAIILYGLSQLFLHFVATILVPLLSASLLIIAHLF